jgi:hypothetical protein
VHFQDHHQLRQLDHRSAPRDHREKHRRFPSDPSQPAAYRAELGIFQSPVLGNFTSPSTLLFKAAAETLTIIVEIFGRGHLPRTAAVDRLWTNSS